MNAVRYGTPRAFLDAAEPFLLRDEAAHNLLLGIPARLAARGPRAKRGAGPGARHEAGPRARHEAGPGARHETGPRAKRGAGPDAASGVYFSAAVHGGEIAAAAMMTPPWRLVLSHTASPGAIRCIAEDVRTARPLPPGVHGPDPIAAEFVEVWEHLTGEPARCVLRERIHRLDEVRPVPAAGGRLRPTGEADRPLLLDWLRAFAAEAFGDDRRPLNEAESVVNTRLGSRTEGLVLWQDGGPRCLAGYAGPTRHGIRIGPVYTPPEHRNRGYATACVAELSRLMLARGRRFCMLFTDLANPASNRIYRRIGYEPVCDVTEYRFLDPRSSAPAAPVSGP